MTTTTTDPITETIDAPGATLTYDVRPSEGATEPPLLMIGSPMGAAGFGTLAGHFADRTVVTYDPRGSDRSVKADPMDPSPPEVHADDVHRVIEAIGGPVDLFASSGGAVNALALVARYPDDVRTLVAHEPPLVFALPDREHARTAMRAVHDTYLRRGWGAGMAHFIALTSHVGELTADWAVQPGPDPAMFGMPTEDDGSRSDPLLGGNMLTVTNFEPDFEAIKSAPTRIIVAVGAESEGQLASRGGRAVAQSLDTEPTVFPGDHGAFTGGEYGQMGKPDEFAAKLREVLSGAS